MIIRIFSDLHCEGRKFVIPPLETDSKTVAVFAGDIGVSAHPETYMSVLSQASEMFMSVIYVLGNHEFYRGVFPNEYVRIKKNIYDNMTNVHVLQDDMVIIDNVAFIGATMWTSLSPMDEMVGRGLLNDFRLIMTHSTLEDPVRLFRPTDTAGPHQFSRKYVFDNAKQAKQDGKKVVIVTHHGVSHQSIADCWKGHPASPLFASDMANEILDARPDLMVHGHVHSCFDYKIGDTRVIVNPRGYAGETNEFNPMLTITL